MNNSPHKVDFKAKQAEFSAYIRNPNTAPCPADVSPDRMQVYRELFFNNVDSFLSSNFPVLHKITPATHWQQLAQDFFATHPCTTPYFSEIPEEFLLYLQNERTPQASDYPFMLELAHYEWVEMALSISQDTVDYEIPEQALTLTDNIRLSPLSWALVYQYPVHHISPDFLPIEAPTQPSYLLVYRDMEDEIKFIELAPMSFHLLNILKNQPDTRIADLLALALPEHCDPALTSAAMQALQQFTEKHIILLTTSSLKNQ